MAEQLEGAVLAIGQQLESLEGEGLLKEGQTGAELLKKVTTSSNLQETVEGAEYVQVSGSCAVGVTTSQATCTVHFRPGTFLQVCDVWDKSMTFFAWAKTSLRRQYALLACFFCFFLPNMTH